MRQKGTVVLSIQCPKCGGEHYTRMVDDDGKETYHCKDCHNKKAPNEK